MDGLAGDANRLGHLGDVQIAILDVPEDLFLQLRPGCSRRGLELAYLPRVLLKLFNLPGRAFLGPSAFLPVARQPASVACHQSISNPWPCSRESPGSWRRPGQYR